MPRIPKQPQESSRTMRTLRTIGSIVIGAFIGSNLATTKKLFSSSVASDIQGRVLATTSLEHPRQHRGPSIGHASRALRDSRQGGTRDRTNGRGWIDPNDRDFMRQRIQLVEQKLKSLQGEAPPVAAQVQPQAQSQSLATSTNDPNQHKHSRTQGDIDFCRKQVFTSQRNPVEDIVLQRTCNDPASKRFNVCHDLVDFTGLTMDEVVVRLARVKQFHFEEEHLFWNPQTTSELAWYYSTSQSYLFANAIHPPKTTIFDRLQKDIHEPVLDYSGGVGNNILYLAMERGLKCQYFGIGMMEKAFAQFRFSKRGLQDMVTVLNPWSEATHWKFDPIMGALPRDSTLGAILAIDVLEHIPDYSRVVAAMVDSLKLGGVIVEQTPFADSPVQGDGADTRIHVHHGGVGMKEAMGDRMVYRQDKGYWEKIKS